MVPSDAPEEEVCRILQVRGSRCDSQPHAGGSARTLIMWKKHQKRLQLLGMWIFSFGFRKMQLIFFLSFHDCIAKKDQNQKVFCNFIVECCKISSIKISFTFISQKNKFNQLQDFKLFHTKSVTCTSQKMKSLHCFKNVCAQEQMSSLPFKIKVVGLYSACVVYHCL